MGSPGSCSPDNPVLLEIVQRMVNERRAGFPRGNPQRVRKTGFTCIPTGKRTGCHVRRSPVKLNIHGAFFGFGVAGFVAELYGNRLLCSVFTGQGGEIGIERLAIGCGALLCENRDFHFCFLSGVIPHSK